MRCFRYFCAKRYPSRFVRDNATQTIVDFSYCSRYVNPPHSVIEYWTDHWEYIWRKRIKMKKVCIVGASGKLGKYMVQHALDRNYEVVGVCRERSVGKLDAFKERIAIIPGATNDREVIEKAVADCDGVLTVLVPWGAQQYSSGTAQAVLDYARPGARLIFSCGQ